MEREILKVTEEEARSIVFGDTHTFKVIEDTIEDTTRWSIVHYVVVQRISDGKYFNSGYSLGATESQDQRVYEYDEPIFTEVFPVEKTIIVYE